MSQSPRFYIFHGEDTFTQKETLADLIDRLDDDPSMVELNTSTFDGRSIKLSELIHTCKSLPFLAKRRLVVVEGLLERLGGKDRKEDRAVLLDYLPQLPPSTRLVFMEKKHLSNKNPFIQAAAESTFGYVKAFNQLQGQALNRWIDQRVTSLGGSIQPQAITMLAAEIGNDLFQLDSEIAKLVSYTALKRPIQTTDVELLTPFSGMTNIFELVDSIGQQNGDKAARLTRDMLESGHDPHYLLSMIIRQFRLLIQVKEKLGQRLGPSDVAREVGIHPFVANKLSQQSTNLSQSRLEDIYRQLLETDLAIKTGQIEPVTAIDLLVAELAN
ncbi:MAG: DNA polymerase III subunit delta [Anaerolineales bacterium]|nr:DNA polymerase III subunit delta [Anaerolineales bacterium]